MSTASSRDLASSPPVPWSVREPPFAIVLGLTVLGVAYTSFSKDPVVTFGKF
jgi:hypothetical protein